MKSNKKTMILEKAFELFRKNGYTDTKVEDITKKLGISKGSFYTYFKTKEELLCELLESIKESEMEKYSKVEIDENPKKTLENFIKERFKSFLELLNNVDIGIMNSFTQNTNVGKFHEEMTKFFKIFIKENGPFQIRMKDKNQIWLSLILYTTYMLFYLKINSFIQEGTIDSKDIFLKQYNDFILPLERVLLLSAFPQYLLDFYGVERFIDNERLQMLLKNEVAMGITHVG